MTPFVAGLLGVALAVVTIALVVRSRRRNDGVDSFRRGLDALGPDARRPVVDQVQSHTGDDVGDNPEPGDTDRGASEPDDEQGGPDGT